MHTRRQNLPAQRSRLRSRGAETVAESPDPGEYFRLAVRFAPHAMVMANQHGEIVLVNDRTEALFGYGCQELIGQSFELLIPKSGCRNYASLLEDFFARGRTRAMGDGVDMLAQRRDGTQFPVEIGLNTVETGGTTWLLCSITDITERKRAEAMLRESEERFRNLADAAPVMIWVSGADNFCTFFNRPWLEFTGATMDQAIGSDWLAGVHPGDREQCDAVYSTAYDARSAFQTECRLRRADGQYRWVLVRGTPRSRSNGAFAGYVGVCVDLTDVRRTHDETLAGQSVDSPVDLANNIAHDFNNLLGGILSSTELILAERRERGFPPEEELLRIAAEAVRGGRIVGHLMVCEGESPAFELVDFAALVEEMLHTRRVSISKHAVLKTELGCSLPVLYADPALIRQVVADLLTNASEAIANGQGVISVTAGRMTAGWGKRDAAGASLPPGEYLRLEVSDTGGGMLPSSHAPGLAGTRGIVSAHHGYIDVQTSPERGTCVEVLLPCACQSTEELTNGTSPSSAGAFGTDAPTVLLVEDEEMLRIAVSKMLRMKGLSVIEALSGNSAVDIFRAREQQVSVVLLDMSLPGMGGPEVFAEMSRIRPDVKVILTTALSQETVLTTFGGRRAWAFLRKPYRIDDLLRLIREACQPDPG